MSSQYPSEIHAELHPAVVVVISEIGVVVVGVVVVEVVIVVVVVVGVVMLGVVVIVVVVDVEELVDPSRHRHSVQYCVSILGPQQSPPS